MTEEQGLLLGFLQVLGFLLSSHLNPEKHLEDLSLDLLHHFLKHFKPFTLVLDERILLSITTQANPFLQVIHGQQMLTPALIYRLQGYQPLHVSRDFRAPFLLFLRVAVPSFFQKELTDTFLGEVFQGIPFEAQCHGELS